MPTISHPSVEPDYRTFDLAGDHYACGFALGQATHLRVIGQWQGRPVDLAIAQACADVVREQHEPLIDEYQGYADGQGRPWSDVLPHFSLNHPAGVSQSMQIMVQYIKSLWPSRTRKERSLQ